MSDELTMKQSKHTDNVALEDCVPCDCVEQTDRGGYYSNCYCSNMGDAESTAAWCERMNNAKELEALKQANAEMLEALEGLVNTSKPFKEELKIVIVETGEVVSTPLNDAIEKAQKAINKVKGQHK